MTAGLRLSGESLMAGPQGGSRVEFRLLGAWSSAGLRLSGESLTSGIQAWLPAALSGELLWRLPVALWLPWPGPHG
jgi:hypothetical protein